MTFKLPDLKLTNQHMLTALAVGIAICAALGLYAFRGAIFSPTKTQTDTLSPTAVTVSAFRHPLTGALVENETEKPFVLAVMIENMIDSWPQSGIEDAFLVIEAPVEAGISRFLAFYGEDQTVEKIGPVRSARPYYVDWALEFDALYVHVGGSDAALRLIASGDTFDLNEYSFGQYFWRSKDRSAPHNVYTSSELLLSALARRQEQGTAPEPAYEIWSFKDDEPAGTDTSDVIVDFSTPTYRVTWDYDPETNRYTRLQAGEVQFMQNGEMLSANNVAILVTSVEILDEIGRRDIETVSEGKAFILQDGRAVEGAWKKNSAEERLRFYNEDGEEIVWNAGQTWVQVVPSEDYVSIEWEGED